VTVKALVVARAGATADADELIVFARERLAGYKRPRSIEFVDDLLRTPSEGLKRFACVRNYRCKLTRSGPPRAREEKK
jgi:acyl-CoA synthetase (AMP-forming)/AMP-acid ligase II